MQTVSSRARSALAVCALTIGLGAIASPAIAAPAAVNLRIEGLRSTIYEAKVTSDGHVVHPAGGPAQSCDGTNGGANPRPGPTATSTLDDGSRQGRFTWAGTFFSGFGDYQIDRIAAQSSNSSQFWGVFVNGTASQVGGCQQLVRTNDEVLWAFDAFNKTYVLKLTGPGSAHTNADVAVRVSNAANNAPLANAVVGGKRTAADGVAHFRFAQPGIYRLKAERSDSVRSRELEVCVDPPGTVVCSSSDHVAPTVSFGGPPLASDRSRTRTFGLRWRGDDGPRGSGITSYRVEARVAGRQAWHPFVGPTELTRTKFRGAPGRSYDFRVSAVDRATNRNRGVTDTVTVPVDDRDRKILRFSRHGWKKLERKGAWGGRVVRSTGPNAIFRTKLRGRRLALIGRELPRGGRLRVSVGGRKRVLRLRGKSRFRHVLWMSKRLPSGRHTLRARTLGHGPVEIDAVAVLP